eukprot:146864-Prorocentrum_lima.AAC.1
MAMRAEHWAKCAEIALSLVHRGRRRAGNDSVGHPECQKMGQRRARASSFDATTRTRHPGRGHRLRSCVGACLDRRLLRFPFSFCAWRRSSGAHGWWHCPAGPRRARSRRRWTRRS